MAVQYTIKDLLFATTLIAIGMFGVTRTWEEGIVSSQIWTALAFFFSGAIIGVGVFALFKRKGLGAILGVFISVLVHLVISMLFFRSFQGFE